MNKEDGILALMATNAKWKTKAAWRGNSVQGKGAGHPTGNQRNPIFMTLAQHQFKKVRKQISGRLERTVQAEGILLVWREVSPSGENKVQRDWGRRENRDHIGFIVLCRLLFDPK